MQYADSMPAQSALPSGMSYPGGYDTMPAQPGYAGQSAGQSAGQPAAYAGQSGYGQPDYGQYSGYAQPSGAQYGNTATFHDYRGGAAPAGMTPYQPPAAAYGGYSSGAYGGDTAAPQYPAAPAAGSFGASAPGGSPNAPFAQYGQSQPSAQYGQSLGQPYQASTPAGSFNSGGYTSGYAQPDPFAGAGAGSFNPLPSSGSFVANQGFEGMGAAGVGPMGQFSNPFLAAMYSTLNGQTDPKNWPQFDVPNMPLAAAARDDAKFNTAQRSFDRHPGGQETAAAAEEDRRKILSPKDKEEKKRGKKKDKEENSGFWFWTCS